MLSRDSLQRQAVAWQTSFLNVIREYVQHLFLSHLYALPQSDHLAFKGGTALRLLYGSPRFSEDLDFTLRDEGQIDKDFLRTAFGEIVGGGLAGAALAGAVAAGTPGSTRVQPA